ncbi:hypothetical protein K431DRAFT_288086 [Polychaeton citri CBS 116435]|uniref:Uncharacterized protein n=1 Tax=Polychaeton citri CBS 116435 TaxID=1314669 RepID=A0A9P4UJG7_9PEZI|nr:hypothetical protein K431DRAFT_288086 [Polychaeton citri CBS 116435]
MDPDLDILGYALDPYTGVPALRLADQLENASYLHGGYLGAGLAAGGYPGGVGYLGGGYLGGGYLGGSALAGYTGGYPRRVGGPGRLGPFHHWGRLVFFDEMGGCHFI